MTAGSMVPLGLAGTQWFLEDEGPVHRREGLCLGADSPEHAHQPLTPITRVMLFPLKKLLVGTQFCSSQK